AIDTLGERYVYPGDERIAPDVAIELAAYNYGALGLARSDPDYREGPRTLRRFERDRVAGPAAVPMGERSRDHNRVSPRDEPQRIGMATRIEWPIGGAAIREAGRVEGGDEHRGACIHRVALFLSGHDGHLGKLAKFGQHVLAHGCVSISSADEGGGYHEVGAVARRHGRNETSLEAPPQQAEEQYGAKSNAEGRNCEGCATRLALEISRGKAARWPEYPLGCWSENPLGYPNQRAREHTGAEHDGRCRRMSKRRDPEQLLKRQKAGDCQGEHPERPARGWWRRRNFPPAHRDRSHRVRSRCPRSRDRRSRNCRHKPHPGAEQEGAGVRTEVCTRRG